ncbi:MAG: uracil-DNA glycosylase [bacterium]|jgi:uracil-DNA glycosylase family 4|nr:MAG: hypothetical protein DIU52_03910 [bacterium]
MSAVRELLARYLRQRRELGEDSLFLETLTRGEALALAAGRRGAAVPDAARAAAATPGAAPAPAAPASALERVRAGALACTRCRLHASRRTVVFGEGPASAEVVVVGEAPGAEEDRSGRPFVGPAGKLLDRLLASAGFPRERVYICNVLKCRPPGNRDPQPDEIASCAPFLEQQIELIAPRALLAVGAFAAQTLVGETHGITTLRGRVHRRGSIPVVVTYHPAYLLRSPERVRAAWQDFQLLRQVVDGEA